MSSPIWDTLEAAATAFTAPQAAGAAGGQQVLELPLASVHPDPNQPRTVVEPDKDAGIQELADSIRSVGFVLEPILVEPDPERSGEWRIVAGERRYHASRLAGRETIRSLALSGLDESQRLAIQLIENLHRKDLKLWERARAFERLKNLTGLKAKEVAKRLGISESSFSAHLRVLKATGILAEALQAGVVGNTETYRLLTELPPPHQERVVQDAIREGAPLSRPALERLLARLQAQEERRSAGSSGSQGSGGQPSPSPLAVGLSVAQWRKLFSLLDLPFPEDPGELAQVLTGLLGEDEES